MPTDHVALRLIIHPGALRFHSLKSRDRATKPSAPAPTCKTLRSLLASSTSGRGSFCARPCKRARVCAFFLQAGFRALKVRIEKGLKRGAGRHRF
jgi:hypothetical protein